MAVWCRWAEDRQGARSLRGAPRIVGKSLAVQQHAVTLRYQLSQRDASAPGVGDLTTRRGTIGIFYTLLGRDRFGTGDW